ncbi:FliM/FliN family flagellar motor switch protein [Parerythrobacter jejuensis]|uniref:Flagellar motor switch protein FliN n=1 Tax=Parerythrobacter jejuensis TaxID=795812 RepID=A0A845AV54_9SPHN|nr:FliM/FliN family flagellar motor switch protein [Parerythrobacter jejuensis]MXP30619.1 flagellar motor switch protein FliN [Parerythrobacter jejuensis]MXP33379.1 flagellar motor switch protein FliN [Parerythrobacter jejuensis]
MNMHANNLKMLGGVTVTVSVELGRTELPLKDVLALGPDSVVALDRLTDELLDVMVNGKLIAKAEVTTQENRFALRIVELSEGEDNGDFSAPVAAMAPQSSADPVPSAEQS